MMPISVRINTIRYILVLLLLTGCAISQPEGIPDTPLRVLFIGNSYTFKNNLPELFAELVRSSGREIDVDMAAPGGWTLADHAASEETLMMIGSQDWDYVVLQEQSVMPSIPADREQAMYPAVRALDEMVRHVGAETVLLMTWGRRDGLAEEGYPDYEAMQAELGVGYTEIGQEVGAIVAPVGLAWQNAIKLDANLALWDSDGSHPSEMGSYLAANVLYAAILGESPLALTYTAGLQTETASFLKRNAAVIVLGGE